MHDDNLQGESRAFVPFRSPSPLAHLLPTCKPFYFPRSFSSSAFFSHLLTGRQEYDQTGAKEQNTNWKNRFWWNLLSSLINTQDIFLTPSLAKTRGPSENHICSFIAPSIPRSWQFGANLGGEGQKLPPPPKIAVSGEELAVVEMMQKVAVVVEMMHFFLQKLMLVIRFRRVVANQGKILKAHSIAKHLPPIVVGFSLQLGISLFVFCPIAIRHSLPFHPMFGFLFRWDGDQYSNGRHVVLKK